MALHPVHANSKNCGPYPFSYMTFHVHTFPFYSSSPFSLARGKTKRFHLPPTSPSTRTTRNKEEKEKKKNTKTKKKELLPLILVLVICIACMGEPDPPTTDQCSSFRHRCVAKAKEKKSRFYILKKCLAMLICWHEQS